MDSFRGDHTVMPAATEPLVQAFSVVGDVRDGFTLKHLEDILAAVPGGARDPKEVLELFKEAESLSQDAEGVQQQQIAPLSTEAVLTAIRRRGWTTTRPNALRPDMQVPVLLFSK